jgi:hypothetical protein
MASAGLSRNEKVPISAGPTVSAWVISGGLNWRLSSQAGWRWLRAAMARPGTSPRRGPVDAARTPRCRRCGAATASQQALREPPCRRVRVQAGPIRPGTRNLADAGRSERSAPCRGVMAGLASSVSGDACLRAACSSPGDRANEREWHVRDGAPEHPGDLGG